GLARRSHASAAAAPLLSRAPSGAPRPDRRGGLVGGATRHAGTPGRRRDPLGCPVLGGPVRPAVAGSGDSLRPAAARGRPLRIPLSLPAAAPRHAGVLPDRGRRRAGRRAAGGDGCPRAPGPHAGAPVAAGGPRAPAPRHDGRVRDVPPALPASELGASA